jgi:hypothetical protein
MMQLAGGTQIDTPVYGLSDPKLQDRAGIE